MIKIKHLLMLVIFLFCGCVSDDGNTFGKPEENPKTGRYSDSDANRENHKKMVGWAIQMELDDWKQGKKDRDGGGLTWEEFWADRFKAYDMYDENPGWSKHYVRERRRQLGLPPLKL